MDACLLPAIPGLFCQKLTHYNGAKLSQNAPYRGALFWRQKMFLAPLALYSCSTVVFQAIVAQCSGAARVHHDNGNVVLAAAGHGQFDQRLAGLSRLALGKGVVHVRQTNRVV